LHSQRIIPHRRTDFDGPYLVSIGPATWLNDRQFCRRPPRERSMLPFSSEIRKGEHYLMVWIPSNRYDPLIASQLIVTKQNPVSFRGVRSCHRGRSKNRQRPQFRVHRT
jgi:hypothetical protein